MSDYIKREDAIKVVADYFDLIGFARRYANSLLNANHVPSADVVERKRGEWVDMGGYEVCKNCHEVKRFPHWNFCPNCGADMRGE